MKVASIYVYSNSIIVITEQIVINDSVDTQDDTAISAIAKTLAEHGYAVSTHYQE